MKSFDIVRLIMLILTWCSVSATWAQWTMLGVFDSHPQWAYTVDFHLRPVSDGCLYYFFTDDPPTPSSEPTVQVYKTLDDGQNWMWVKGFGGYSYSGCDLEAPHPDTAFFTFYYMANANLIRTVDGGNTWQTVNYFGGPEEIYFISGSKGYGVDLHHFFRYENDTMEVVDTLDWTLWQAQIGFSSSDTGYIIFSMTPGTERNTVIRTIDDGDSWEIVLNDSQQKFHDIQVPSASTVYVACDGGYLYKSVDQGDNWELVSVGTSANIRSISFISAERGYALANDGVVHFTMDGGATWTEQYMPNDTTWPKAIRMINDTVGYIHASIAAFNTLEVLLKTTNGGITGIEKTYASGDLCTVYPVPFNDRLNILVNPGSGGPVSCTIRDLNGAIRYRNIIPGDSGILSDLGNMSQGIYIIELTDGKITQTSKIIKVL